MKTETMQIRVLTPSENHFLLNENEKVITETEKEALEKEWEKEISMEGAND